MRLVNVTGLDAEPERNAYEAVGDAMEISTFTYADEASILGAGFEPFASTLPWRLVDTLFGVFRNG